MKRILLALALCLLAEGAFAQGAPESPNQFLATPLSGSGYLVLRPIGLADISTLLTFSNITGSLICANLPALTGDITSSGCATVLATVNSTPGSFGGANSIPTFTSNGKGLFTASGAVTPSIPFSEITGVTKPGSTTILATTSGVLSNGHCVQIDSGGNFVDAGGSCTIGGGGGTVSAGSLNQIAYYASAGTVVSGETLLQAVNFPVLTGDITTAGGTLATVLATVNGTPGTFGGANSIPTFTSNGKGLMTASGAVTPSIPATELTGTLQAAQEPAHTGDVTNTAGALALTIAANDVTYAKLQQVAASSLVGNPTGSLANAQGITLGAALTFSGTALQTAAMTGDITTPANSFVTTLATVNANTGAFGSSTAIPNFTVNGKGLITAAATNAVIAPAGTLTGGILAAGVTASTLTSLGTLVNLGLSGPINESQSIGATSTDGLVLADLTAAGAGAQKWAPRVHWTGQGWKTNATAGSQTVDIIEELQPVQGAANPTGNLVWSSSVNGGSYGVLLTLGTGGGLNLNAGTYQIGGSQIAFSNIAGLESCAQLPALTGDITSASGLCATTLANTAVTAGSYGDATHIPIFTVDAKGRLTAASSTTFSGGGGGTVTNILEHGGRLTLVASGPVMVGNTTSATALYYAPYVSPFVSIYNGSTQANYQFTSGPTDTVGLTLGTWGSGWSANSVYDVFATLSGGVPVLCTGPAWTDSNTRTSAGSLARYNGEYTNSNASAMTCRTSNAATISVSQYQATYLGTIATDAAGKLEFTPQTSTSCGGPCGPNYLYVWNEYNRRMTYAYEFDNTPGGGTTYSGALPRTANANLSNRIYYIVGQVEDTAIGYYQSFDKVGAPGSAGAFAQSGFWNDMVTDTSTNGTSVSKTSNIYMSNSVIYRDPGASGGGGFPGVGTSYFAFVPFPVGVDFQEALENSDGVNTSYFGYFGQQVLEFQYPM